MSDVLSRDHIIQSLVWTLPTKSLREEFWMKERLIYNATKTRLNFGAFSRSFIAPIDRPPIVFNDPEYLSAIMQMVLLMRQEAGLGGDNA